MGGMTRVKTAKEIESMRVSGKMLATVLAFLKSNIASGMTTKELADMASRELKSLGGKPAFLGYSGFPDVLCVSVNDEVVHGIPSSDRILNDGDVVGMDFGVVYNTMITDAAISVIVGNSNNKKAQNLVADTESALMNGISVVKNGVKVGDISAAVQLRLKKGKWGIVRDLVGHGVGHELHEEPNIPNVGQSGKGPVLKSGMTIAIEPMVTMGGHRVYLDKDNWTIKTWDGSVSAHFEHTVLVTDSGFEILTIVD